MTETNLWLPRPETWECSTYKGTAAVLPRCSSAICPLVMRWLLNSCLGIPDNDVRTALRKLDSKGTAMRKPGPRKRRERGGEYIVRGPDWLRCIDGHDKFRNYGIGIYAVIDAFSRKILWFYTGNSNRRAALILHQAVATIRSFGRYRRF